MIKLFAKDKSKTKTGEENVTKSSEKLSPVELRLQKGTPLSHSQTWVNCLFLPPSNFIFPILMICSTLMYLFIQMKVSATINNIGFYKHGRFEFTFKFPKSYPFDPPKVKCSQVVRLLLNLQIFHPNIDTEGNVCLNILREDWKPVLNINSIIYGLQFLFLEPNAEDPLNKGIHVYNCSIEAAELLRTNKQKFADTVSRTMKGYSLNNRSFDYVLSK